MKALYGVAGAAIIIVVLLAPVALFPETVMDVADDLRVRYVDRWKQVADLKRQVAEAENGDLDRQYVLAYWHLSEGEWWRHEILEEGYGPRDREKGEAMMRELIQAGHPEALYHESGGIDGDQDIWRRALFAGSRMAVREFQWRFIEYPCDDSLYSYAVAIRPLLDNPDFPWQHPDATYPTLEMRERSKAILRKDISLLDSVRAEKCTSE